VMSGALLGVVLTAAGVLGLGSETPRPNGSPMRRLPAPPPPPRKQPAWKELFTLKHDAEVTAVAANGKMVAAAEAGCRLRLWGARDGKELDLEVRGATTPLPANALRFTAKDAYLMMTAGDGAFRYEQRAGGMVSDTLAGFTLLAWSADLSTLVTPNAGHPANPVLPNRLYLHGDVWRDSKLYFNYTAVVEEPVGVTITHVTLSGDGRLLAVARDDAVVRVRDRETLRERCAVRLKKGQRLTGVQLSEDGKLMACVGEAGFAKVFATADGKELCTLKGHAGAVTAVAISPDGKRVATANGKVVRVFDARSGRPGGEITGHGGDVRALAFFPDGKRLVTGSVDKAARVWELSE
jgi:WD40 repeat protein